MKIEYGETGRIGQAAIPKAWTPDRPQDRKIPSGTSAGAFQRKRREQLKPALEPSFELLPFVLAIIFDLKNQPALKSPSNISSTGSPVSLTVCTLVP